MVVDSLRLDVKKVAATQEHVSSAMLPSPVGDVIPAGRDQGPRR
jgi:hypothetical protein